MSSKKEESRSREKSNNNNHSTKPFSLQKSSNQWMIIKYRFLNSRKDFQLTWKLVSQAKRQKKDYLEMVQINSHKKKECIGLSSFFMSLQVPSPCYFGQVVFYVLSLMLCPHKIQVTCIWVLCCSLSIQWQVWWVSIKICKVRPLWVVLKILFPPKLLSLETEFKVNWTLQNWLSEMSLRFNLVRKFLLIWESLIPKEWRLITHL